MARWLVGLVAIASLATACADGEAPTAADPPAASETPASETPEEPLPCVPGAEPFTGAAADEFGAEQVMAAYCLFADLALEQEKTSLALPVPEQKARDLDSARDLLTAEAARGWPALVRERSAGAEASVIDGLTLHDVRQVPAGYQRADDGPYVFGTRVGPATAELRGEMLALSFDLETGLVLEERGDDTGRHSLLPVTRSATFVLVSDGDGWLIDGWEASFEHGQVRVVGG